MVAVALPLLYCIGVCYEFLVSKWEGSQLFWCFNAWSCTFIFIIQIISSGLIDGINDLRFELMSCGLELLVLRALVKGNEVFLRIAELVIFCSAQWLSGWPLWEAGLIEEPWNTIICSQRHVRDLWRHTGDWESLQLGWGWWYFSLVFYFFGVIPHEKCPNFWKVERGGLIMCEIRVRYCQTWIIIDYGV